MNIGVINLNVTLKNKNAAFLIPNQYFNYNQIPDIVILTQQMCQGKNKNECLKIIKNYIKCNYVYDFIKAINIKKNMLPDI